MGRRESFVGNTEKFAMGGMVVIAALSLGLMTVLLWPFAPLEFRSITYAGASPGPNQSTCPGMGVATDVDYFLDPAQFDNLESLQVLSNWEAVDVPTEPIGTTRLASDAELPKTLLRPGDTKMRSRILRPAPITPGTWRLVTESTATGVILGRVPKIQSVEVETPGLLTVLSPDSPRCDPSSERRPG